MAKLAAVAIGGNALIRPGQRGTVEEQRENAALTMRYVAQLIQQDYRVVLTHGNGPQVGAQLLRSELAANQISPDSLALCVASTQGSIGALLVEALENALRTVGLKRAIIPIGTRVLVDDQDPAFAAPSKPIGLFYSAQEAQAKMETLGWAMIEEGSQGYRRVVASPRPCAILELESIGQLVAQGAIVIAAGGGGVPVVAQGDAYRFVDAVIDKDASSALLAHKLGADILVISTAENHVYINYRQPTQQALTSVTAAVLEGYYREGHFPAGTMGPKILAALSFLRHGGHEVIITTPECLPTAVNGQDGTHIMADAAR